MRVKTKKPMGLKVPKLKNNISSKKIIVSIKVPENQAENLKKAIEFITSKIGYDGILKVAETLKKGGAKVTAMAKILGIKL